MFSSFWAFLFQKDEVFRPIRSTDSIRFFRRVGQVVGQALNSPHADRVDPSEFHCPLWGRFRTILVKGDGHAPGPPHFLQSKLETL